MSFLHVLCFLAGAVVLGFLLGVAAGYYKRSRKTSTVSDGPTVTPMDGGPIQAGPPPTDPPLNNGGNA